MYKSQWLKWGARLKLDGQKQRLEKAKTGECTPISIDSESGIGIFGGSHGQYKTSLSECNCRDFTIRHAPCKHIYRLAIELGIISEPKVSDTAKIKRPIVDSYSLKESIEKIEFLSPEIQLAFKGFLLEHLFHKRLNMAFPIDTAAYLIDSGLLIQIDDNSALLHAFTRDELNSLLTNAGIVGFKKNLKLDALINWCLEHINTQIRDICSSVIACTLNPKHKKSIRKTYSYLCRKFDIDYFYDVENDSFIQIPKGSKATYCDKKLILKFPDDEITDLLNKYNVNPCSTN